MKRFMQTLMATVLTLSISAISFGGTITGSRTNRTGTITGSSVGTITGSRTGTITGSRNGVFTGSSSAPTENTNQRNRFSDDWMSQLLMLLLNASF
jgi:hypothetical protein